MPRKKGSLSEAQIATMQARRIETAKERADAMEALTNNPAFTEWKFWKKVPEDLQYDVVEAIEKALIQSKKKYLEEIESEAAELREELFGDGE
ncbi:MAG: hypothetical protein KAI66_24005 [Lentisphaeria bacterium]|nr:hypothetical protein [Lentisphaeria bacterium]